MVKLKTHLYVLLVLFHISTLVPLKSTAATSAAAPSRTQAEALIKWKNSLISSFSSLESWSIHNLSNLCNWTGIVCTSSGQIPNWLGNLTKLESLDLSVNKMKGGIPWQLTRLTFLAAFNVSQNQLAGAIPEGGQFNTFSNNSYQGNPRLCGNPLTKKCRDDDVPSNPRPLQPKEDSVFFNGFTWQSVLMGYGCGTWIGFGIGYLIFLTGKPKWVVGIVERAQSRKARRSRKEYSHYRTDA